ncbi:hypothetical protein D3C81_1285830 [compost metagenome]
MSGSVGKHEVFDALIIGYIEFEIRLSAFIVRFGVFDDRRRIIDCKRKIKFLYGASTNRRCGYFIIQFRIFGNCLSVLIFSVPGATWISRSVSAGI